MSYAFKGNDFIVLQHGQVIKGTNSYDTTTTLSNETNITLSTVTTLNWNGGGNAVSIGNGFIVASAPTHSGAGFGWILDYNGILLHTLSGSDAVDGDRYGSGCAIGGNRIVVSAYAHNSDRGEGYIYTLGGQELTTISSTSGISQFSGDEMNAVSIGCGRIVMGISGTSIGGQISIFDLNGNHINTTSSEGGNNAANTGMLFGKKVAVGCGRIVATTGFSAGVNARACIYDLDGSLIGQILKNTSATLSVAVGNGLIVIGDYGIGSGRAYVYNLKGDELFQLTPSNTPSDHDNFGSNVAIGCGRIFVGATSDDAGAGAVYVFDLDGNQIQRLTNSTADANFGSHISVYDGKVAILSDISGGGTKLHIYDTPNIKFHQDLANGR